MSEATASPQPALVNHAREGGHGPSGFGQAQGDPFKVLSLFAGIGGFDLGLERTGGFKTVAFCEIDPFCQRVLAKHWPEVPCYHDVRELTAARLAADGIAIDIICGGFPCQDLSTAGNLAGIAEGTRSGLWSEVIRLVREIRPRYLLVENVANLLRGPAERPGAWFGRVLGDLAEFGFDAEWENIPAAAMGAPHRRERIWLVAYPMQERARGATGEVAGEGGATCREGRQSTLQAECGGQDVADADSQREPQSQRMQPDIGGWISYCGQSGNRTWSPEPAVGRVAHGIPNRTHRIAALGNAVIPQIPELIGRAILEAEAR